jgi:hypothetical protein
MVAAAPPLLLAKINGFLHGSYLPCSSYTGVVYMGYRHSPDGRQAAGRYWNRIGRLDQDRM